MENTSSEISTQNVSKSSNTDCTHPTSVPSFFERGHPPNLPHHGSGGPHQFYPPVPGYYYPFCPVPWQYMNYFNLDALRQFTIEFGHGNGPINEGMINWNLLKELQNIRKSDSNRRYNKQDQSYWNNDNCRADLCTKCVCCQQQLRCRGCSHPLTHNRVIPCICCNFHSESCTAFHSFHSSSNCQCPHNSQKYSANHNMCEENRHIQFNCETRGKNCRKQDILCNTESFNSNTEETTHRNIYEIGKNYKENVTLKTQLLDNTKGGTSENNIKSNIENCKTTVGGSGDERMDLQSSFKPDVRPPESYFLSMSLLGEE